ncbi:MAG TPA: hypothetical protein DCZ05_02825 [Deltaproteobacteria bacterium]|nr:MAG: hypothetical protein A2X89_06085 [Deltaproteobacteria bacterium GWD2_55_8]OGQ97105.1 MAG: hypothetical protein A2253_10100 [Deltaproteobacteria bacterium RIFOXYA2_FULL_55_11]HBA38692.1 hypothetical protein [Deltaproteobacteria bacterium]
MISLFQRNAPEEQEDCFSGSSTLSSFSMIGLMVAFHDSGYYQSIIAVNLENRSGKAVEKGAAFL